MDVTLRPVETGDLNLFFDFHRDPNANRMAALTTADPADPTAFEEHWTDLLHNPESAARTILANVAQAPGQAATERIAGYVVMFPNNGEHEVTYWIDPTLWGRGLASAALAHFLVDIPTRPLNARVVDDNAPSLRILRRCGFSEVGREQNYARARGEDVTEILLQLS